MTCEHMRIVESFCCCIKDGIVSKVCDCDGDENLCMETEWQDVQPSHPDDKVRV